MEVFLKPKVKPLIPVEAEVLTPDRFAGMKLSEIEGLPVYVGNRVEKLSDYFELEGSISEKPADQQITILGDASRIKYIGYGMTAGRILVEGGAGMHLGSHMSGGEIVVKGNASDWAGAEMSGGLISILGNTGDLLGSAYRGSREGMTGGCIIVKGNAGIESGIFMRRGTIVVEGEIGSFAGAHMNGGAIFIFGKASRGVGAEMRGNGSMIVCFKGVDSLLPTFIYNTIYKPNFMRIYLKFLFNTLKIDKAGEYFETPFKRYVGDAAVGGDGEIFIAET
ncbi:formylmethanofuran dehydrogenase subunit C [Candidatus Bathyarchaeota archaeon]|nr:formylmethanofuran dehydrogenase subunit C [Candidatus Bathyarchaeota archaeon]